MKYLALVYPADLLRRLGRDASARGADERALAPTDNGDERRFLERRLARSPDDVMRQNGAVVRHRAQGGTLVLGGGFAGAYVARLLRERGCTVVSPQNSMLYTPLLPEAASGTLEPRHVVVPLRQMCPHAEVVIGRATTLDLDERVVSAETLAGRRRSPTSDWSSRSAP